MNARLNVWASGHPNITVVNVHDLVKELMDDNEIHVWGNMWPAGSQPKLLQPDMLHPTFEGTVALCLLFAEAIKSSGLETDSKVVLEKAAALARTK